MPQIKTITARTQAMKKAGERPVAKDVEFPTSIAELKQGIGPWKTVKEMFEDAYSHRRVIIQAKMRQALENGSDESEEDESGLAFEE